MLPWVQLAKGIAPDGAELELRRRGAEFVMRAGGHELMSSEDASSSRALADLGCAHLVREPTARVLIGGLGMGFTLRAALDCVASTASVEQAELLQLVVDWNRGAFGLGELAGHPLDDPRVTLSIRDVAHCIRDARDLYDAILLDVDNGPLALAHPTNNALYREHGLGAAWQALRPSGVLAVWSLLDDEQFTKRLTQAKFHVDVHRVFGSRRGRGREHVIWVATK